MQIKHATTLCLNMIVKNEMANLDRCLRAVADHLACWVIGDTGSSDGSQEFIASFFAERAIPGEVYSFEFRDFGQARNTALEHAAATTLPYDYLLLADADMELVVEDRDFRGKLGAPGYRLLQRTNSGLTYWNTRLVRRGTGARYHGVTHEYIDVPGGVKELGGVWYKDHASGSNRVDKFERDIRLLSEALEREPENRRYWFYLAQSYRDAGQKAKAVEIYSRRAAMGGWDEEAWYARLQLARLLRDFKDEGGFIREALAAFNQRPQRAEPLYDLARFYRERGMNGTSMLFSEFGLTLPRPEQDILFIEDMVYQAGLSEEYSIAANYARDPARKERGHDACNWLALNRGVAAGCRNLARSNLAFYLQSAASMMPSFRARPVGFIPPDGYYPTNPSVARWGEQILMVQRTVNYLIAGDNQYETPNGAPVHTRNFLLRLDRAVEIQSSIEILSPIDIPEPSYQLVRGFEDMRLFAWRDELWCSSTVRELNPAGWCEQVLARIEQSTPDDCRLTGWRVLRPEGPRLHEKNWMPLVDGDRLRFIYLCDPTRIVDEQARKITETQPPIAAEQFRGGSQAIRFDGGYLALIHEVLWWSDPGRRSYQHRFVWIDEAGLLRRVSRAFFFQKKSVEFAAGLAWHPDGKQLLISFSTGDRESWLATVDAREVRSLLQDVERLNSGAPLIADPIEPRAVGAPDLLVQSAGGAAASRPSIRVSAAAFSAKSTDEKFLQLASFLRAADSPADRRKLSQEFDERLGQYLTPGDTASLPRIHCFYEVLSDRAQHHSLIAATTSMRAAGHAVQVWSYSPQKLDFLMPYGIEMRSAEEILPRGMFERIVASSEIRYFSDSFRYAVLYEHGGLWMDTDVVLLRAFPFRGDYFLNLQWGNGGIGHFVCGNVMFAKPHSHHLRTLYETSLDHCFRSRGKKFGEIGPKLLSDYVMSDAGVELTKWLFSPVLFNSIDWNETEKFERPLSDLVEYLNDERVFGVHLWNARTNARSRDEGASLISLLSNPLGRLPSLTTLSERFNTDKNRHTGNRHFYSRIYDQLLSARRLSLRRLMEIGLCRGLAEQNQSEMPSVELWQAYFPFCKVLGVDLTDFSKFNNDRFSAIICDQSKPDQLRAVAASLEPGSIDVIIDDGSHASFDQQATLRAFFPLLVDGGWYFIEDLDWQPTAEHPGEITVTKHLLHEIQQHGTAQSFDPMRIGELAGQMSGIHFFDSHYELNRATLLRIGRHPQARRSGPGVARSSHGAPILKIAVYTIALNEAGNAERWANSAVDADYRIVADTGSTDETVECLTRAGVTVHRITIRPWRFDDARNAALALVPADVDVCATMDMDRFLEPGWREKLETVWTPDTTALFCRVAYRSSVDDPTPLRWWPAKNFHSRWRYRFRRPVHEALSFNGEKEVTRSCDDIVMCEVQDLSKPTRAQYLPLMELAHREDPEDAQMCFWLGREYMWARRYEQSAALLHRYLALPSSTWREERSEAMRYLARVQPDETLAWLDRARGEAPHRHEIWVDLAEKFHSQSDWLNLFWACSNGIEKTHCTGSYLDDASSWGFRLFDLGAIGAWHLNVMDLAIKWGEKALELASDDQGPRLKNNLDFFIRRRAEIRAGA